MADLDFDTPWPAEVSLPWHHQERGEDVKPEFPSECLGFTYICDHKEMVLFDIPELRKQALAKHRHCITFMLRAVNAHDDLVAACKSALYSFERYETQCLHHPLFGELRAALAKAEAPNVT